MSILNANMVRRWISAARRVGQGPPASSAFVPVRLPAAASVWRQLSCPVILIVAEHASHSSNAITEKLTHEAAVLKRHKFASRNEQMGAVQGRLLGAIDHDELLRS
ncbi:hypothetical protein [Marinobacter caseinilyticus]|uniref:hypothetical protein n=1 Tax=Marinobacter caseinilyticus TaxID=2692195 RepID=UPI00140D6BB1|nr:hypothetical protein [Marinobacter caseinilyticus]